MSYISDIEQKALSHIGNLRIDIDKLINDNQCIMGGSSFFSRDNSDYYKLKFIRENIDMFDFFLVTIKNIIFNIHTKNYKFLETKNILSIIISYFKCINSTCDVLVNEYYTSANTLCNGYIYCNLSNYGIDIQKWIDIFTNDLNDIRKEEEEENKL